jgi:catechol 2,3-dioxygenase-like lactoylglutathione lyase family enzyme
MYWVSGIQQIGIGVHGTHEAWTWYRRNLGFDILVFDDLGTAIHMLPHTGGSPQDRHAILAMNLQGGGGLEFWQFATRTPKSPAFDVQIGDLGINIAKIKSKNVASACSALKNRGVGILGGMLQDPAGNECFYIKDLYGNLLQVMRSGDVFSATGSITGGVLGAIIGVTDAEKSAGFYRGILGYDTVIYDRRARFQDFGALPGGSGTFRRMLLAHGERRKGPFCNLLGESRIELVQALDRVPNRIYENRLWGDPGFIHICFDIRGILDLKMRCEQHGSPFTADSNPEACSSADKGFEMDGSSGHFAYIEDPDGTLIEFVETHKIAIAKKIGWYLDLRRRKSEKPLPDWMLKTLRWNRVKDRPAFFTRFRS